MNTVTKTKKVVKALTQDDLRLKEKGAAFFKVLNHYSFSKYVAEILNSAGEHWMFKYGNTLADLKEGLVEQFTASTRYNVEIKVYTANSKLAYFSEKHTTKLVKQ